MKRKIKKIAIGFIIITSLLVSVGYQSDFFEIAKQIDIYTTLFKELNIHYVDEVNPAKLTNNAINNMLKNLDPYTRYYDEQGVEDARIASMGEYGGIGVVTKFINKSILIEDVIKNSPAQKANLKPGDKILKIDETFVKDFQAEGASSLLNGLPNTKINLQIERQNRTFDVTLTRKKISINPVPYYTMVTKTIGYISFTKFNQKAASEVKKAMLDLKDQGMQQLIIDVRNNPGGLLNEAVKITNFFIPKDKIVVTTKAKTEQWSETFKTYNDPIDTSIPLIILVNNHSASASEILAGSLQDYDRAVIIGNRSFGKGLVQRYRELPYGTQMKLTISKYYTPSGRCIQELDYTNRDDKGNVPKFSDAGRKSYKTEKGRTVYGGGGILPDVDLKQQELNKTTETLFNSEAFFNYATQYFYKNNSIKNPLEFRLKESDFNNLMAYLNNHNEAFKTKTEEQLLKVKKEANEDDLSGNFNTVFKSIKTEKLNNLAKDKAAILNKLEENIIQRYFYDEGVFQHKIKFDQEIAKAVSVLDNPNQYKKILEN
ncbi:MAG: S41 family peptidase [Lutibacter sp.]|uniref:S41 family peptidase n=1 Tax=Lutibacter sp. TaxID=1925666 RepID=UPI00299F4049|nr:S41 family peptidase [Lutibacter sp.]MDX1830128.1 S41 family peptidase [Lutibacter sp.]